MKTRFFTSLALLISLGFFITGCGRTPYNGEYFSQSNLPRGIDLVLITIDGDEMNAGIRIGQAQVSHIGTVTKVTQVDGNTYEIEATAKVRSTINGLEASDDIPVKCVWKKGATKYEDSIEYSNEKMSFKLKRHAKKD